MLTSIGFPSPRPQVQTVCSVVRCTHSLPHPSSLSHLSFSEPTCSHLSGLPNQNTADCSFKDRYVHSWASIGNMSEVKLQTGLISSEYVEGQLALCLSLGSEIFLAAFGMELHYPVSTLTRTSSPCAQLSLYSTSPFLQGH